MEMCTARGITNLPLVQPKDLAPKHIQSIPSITRYPFIRRQVVFNAGLRHCRNISLRSATSEATSTDTTPYEKDESEPDGVIIVENTRKGYSKQIFDAKPTDAVHKGYLVDNPLELLKFLKDFDIKFDHEDTYSVLVLGAGGAVALWLASATVGAIDSIPLLPKMLELVGLGYMVWFSSRYLIFKENRDELFARVEQMKQEVLGSTSKDD
ncbi:hypothetical protein OROHE_000360 [Orobanche hederae]